jgi:hypothetical protein
MKASERKHILRIATGFTKGMLGKGKPNGMCFAVSTALQGYLMFSGYESELKECDVIKNDETYNHFYLQFKEGTILDATASQFNEILGLEMPLIYLGNKPDYYLELTNKELK